MSYSVVRALSKIANLKPIWAKAEDPDIPLSTYEWQGTIKLHNNEGLHLLCMDYIRPYAQLIIKDSEGNQVNTFKQTLYLARGTDFVIYLPKNCEITVTGGNISLHSIFSIEGVNVDKIYYNKVFSLSASESLILDYPYNYEMVIISAASTCVSHIRFMDTNYTLLSGIWTGGKFASIICKMTGKEKYIQIANEQTTVSGYLYLDMYGIK